MPHSPRVVSVERVGPVVAGGARAPSPVPPSPRPAGRARCPTLVLPVVAGGLVVALTVATVLAQGSDSGGHPTLNGQGVFAAWNPSAGRGSSGGYASEDRPNLAGWDYRINVPYVRLNPTYFRNRSAAAMVGVVEDTTHAAETLDQSLHVNNAIWLFSVDAGGVLRFKVLPSRRSATSSAVENVSSLSADWYPVGPAGTLFKVEKPSAVVLGQGIGTATIYAVARATDGRLLLTSRRVDSPSITTWPTPWVRVAPSASNPASASAAFGDRVAIAWPVGAPSHIEARLYNPATANFGPVRRVTGSAGAPQLVWDGTALNLFYIGPIFQQHVWHTFATRPQGFSFEPPTRIGDTVINAHCDAIAFNRRLHVACARLAGTFRVWYSTSTTPFGTPSAWEPASEVGLDDHSEPQLGTVGDLLYVVASSRDGVLQYARKDPHVVPYEWTGGPEPREQWLERGIPVDGLQAQLGIRLWGAELLSFNHDLYLTAAQNSTEPTAGLYLVNMSRAALKSLIQRRLGIRFVWGRDGDGEIFRAGEDPIATRGGTFLLADVSHDGRADLIRAAEGPQGGELRVALAMGSDLAPSTGWLASFARPGDVVRAGDVDGDGFADLVRAFKVGDIWNVHVAYSSGTGIRSQIIWRAGLLAGESTPLIGDVTGDGKADLVLVRFADSPAPVEVAWGGPRSFGRPSTWSRAMAVRGDLPLLADVNGDGRKDLVIVSSTPPSGGGAPRITVAFSTGSAFSSRMVWGLAPGSVCRSYDVGDFNQDGREDLVCFQRDRASGGPDRRSVYVLFSEVVRFSELTTLLTSFVGERELPLVGNLSGDTKGTYTHVPGDAARPILDLVSVNLDTGRIGWMPALSLFPVPSGVPWERYRFFTEKGLGTAMFPEWLWTTTPCVKPWHQYLLLGAAGSGSPRVTRLSVRPGSSQGHVLEELGHSVFANCIPGPDDPFGLLNDIFSQPISGGGFEANNMADSCNVTTVPPTRLPGAPNWVDCRDPQHYFLAFMKVYRTAGDLFRGSIAVETDAVRKAALQARYAWLKARWFNGVEFYRDPTVVDARRETHGLQCLRDYCP